MDLRIHSYETFTTSDGPGIRFVLFIQGCNFRCLYCQNPDTINPMGNSKLISSDEIIAKLKKQRSYFKNGGGLTVSGGEPTFQAQAVLELFQKAKFNDFHTCLDTNGFIFSDLVHQLYDYTDLIIFDLKHIDNFWHQKITSQKNDTVLQNILYREKQAKAMWLRYVLVPGLSDQEEFIEKWAQYFQNYQHIARFEILPYHTLGVHKYQKLGLKYQLKNVPRPSQDSIAKTKQIFEKYLKNVYVR